uniref:Transmembrane protein n=1 Tax=Bursaphelenchus xylophilus TaxID=6326 RepID=A0A1I7RJG0_BURXY
MKPLKQFSVFPISPFLDLSSTVTCRATRAASNYALPGPANPSPALRFHARWQPILLPNLPRNDIPVKLSKAWRKRPVPAMRPQKRHRFVHLAATICSSASAVLSFPQRARPDGTDQMSPVEQFLYGQQTLIHTFGTPESCARNCPRACTVQEVEDLMMPRWICPSKPDDTTSMHLTPTFRDSRDLGQDLFPFSSQFLLILVPLATLLAIILLIVWCRRYANSSYD